MNRLRLILIAAALVAALLAAYLSTGLINRPPPAIPAPAVVQKPDASDVLVATRNLGEGEPLGNFAVEWRAWPRDLLAPDMITKEAMPDAVEQMQQARARLPIILGEPIVAAKIVRPGDRSFVSAILPPGMRAVSVPITEMSAVSGLILPKDRVDVILTRQVTGRNGDKTPVSETLLNNVTVLAINQSLRPGPDGAPVPDGRTAVLELDAEQSVVLARAAAGGTLTLVLRPLTEGESGGPTLSDAFLNPRRATTGPLIIRYGLERTVTNP